MTTVADLYTQVLGRAPDAGGLAYWESVFGNSVDPAELATFKSVAQVTEPERVAAAPQQLFDPFSSSINPANLQAVQKLDISNLPSTYGRLFDGTGGDTGGDPTPTGYFSTNEVVNGIPVTTYYDAQGNVTKYVAANATQNLSDTYRQSAEWDPTGAAKPVNWSVDNGLFNSGVTFDDVTKAAILAMTAAGTLGAGAPTGGETEALSGIDLGGVGASPNTWLGGSTYGAVPAAISSVVPAGAEAALSPVVAANAGSSAVAPVTAGAGSSLLPSIGSLTPSQIASLTKAGISAAGLLGGAAAVGGLTGGGGANLTLPTQDRSGISSGSAQYSPEYYQAIQAKYNQMMPQQPRDVTTDLKNWYETKYAPKVA